MYRPGGRGGYAQHSANGAWLNDGRESFIKVNAALLGKAATDSACLVARERTIRVKFVAKYPLAGNNVCTRGFRHKIPGVIG